MSRKVCHILLGLAWLLIPGSLFGQGQMATVRYFDERDGLNCTAINDILQDRFGFIWLGTAEGLVRYDGYTFKAFQHISGDSTSIYSNHVLKIIEDSKGNIWAGLARGGVSCYNRSTGVFKNYPFTLELKNKTASIVGVFFDKDEELWLGVGLNGLVHLDKKTGNFQRFDVVTAKTAPYLASEISPFYNTVYSFWQDEKSKIWCATTDGLYCFDPQTGVSEPIITPDLDAPEKLNNQAYSILHDGDLFWIGGWASGVRSFNRKTGAWKQYYFDKKISDITNIVNEIVAKTEEELWIMTQERGIGVFNKKTEQFYFFADHPAEFPELTKMAVGDFFADNQGNYWMRSNNRLARIQFKTKVFQFHPVKSTALNDWDKRSISMINEDSNGRYLVVGTNDSPSLLMLDKATGKTTETYFSANSRGVGKQVMDVLATSDEKFWILTRHEIYQFDPIQMRIEKTKQPPIYDRDKASNYYTQFGEDLEGKLWMGTSFLGVIRFDPKTGASEHFMPDEQKLGTIASNVVGIIAVDGKGRVWYGSRDKTAYGYFNAAKQQFIYLDNNGNRTKNLASMRVNNCFTDRLGNMTVCTEEGLLYFDCTGDTPRMLKKYSISDGLPSDYVVSSTLDKQGNIWCTTAAGISKIDIKTDKISSFGKEDGIDFPLLGIVSGSDGMMYVSSVKGYYTFDPNALRKTRSQVPMALCSFKVDDKELYFGSEVIPGQQLNVPAESRFFSFEFAALDFTTPEALQYEYQLENFDNQWVKAGTRRFVNYTNIPAGQYNFKVRLAGTGDDEALSIPISVRVSFYKTKWFWSLIGAGLIAFTIWFYRNRRDHERQLQELKGKTQLLEKEKAVVMYESLKQQLNPHFLFNSLTSLSSLIQIDQKAAAGFLENLSKSYRYILKSSEQETVPISEELKFTGAFVVLQKTRFREGLFVNFNVSEEYYYRKIVPVTLQNLIENAIKHNIIDDESPLVIEVFVADDCLVVRNNLQKKKFVETSNRKGLNNLQSFYRYLSDRKIDIAEDEAFFTVKIPLI